MRIMSGLGRDSDCSISFEREYEQWVLEIEKGTQEPFFIRLNQEEFILLEHQIRMVREEFIDGE